MISKFVAKNFTAFSDLNIAFSPGINIFIGKNGTGKTHIMKAVYAACSVIDSREVKTLEQKVYSIFLPNTIGRLVRRSKGRGSGSFVVHRWMDRERTLSLSLTTQNKVEVKGLKSWQDDVRFQAIYIPVKDMLANAPGFRSLFNGKHIYFEEIYADIIDKALMPAPKGAPKGVRKDLITMLSDALDGKVVEKDEMFFLKNKSGVLEFILLAEGFRKLGLLYKLIQNESLTSGSVLFWDEPEANLNPALTKVVVRILLRLQQMGVQIFIATHDYSLLKNFELEASPGAPLLYHSLYENEAGEVVHSKSYDLNEVAHNAIDEAYEDLLERSIEKRMRP